MKQTLLRLAALAALVLTLALPAAAQQPEITRQTTLRQLRQKLAHSGYYTYCKELTPLEIPVWQDRTLEQYMNKTLVDDSVKAMNLVLENDRSGIQVAWNVYPEQEIAEKPVLEDVQLYYFPSDQMDGRYALVVPGNASTITSEMEEGGSAAAQLHELGYTVFVLRYRSFLNAGDNAPLEDLGRAVQFLTEHAEQFHIRPENYALVAFSSGGQLAGLFANQELGWGRFQVPKPGALLMAYPVANFSVLKPVYHVIMDTDRAEWRYYWSNLYDVVTDDYPPVFFWSGKNDTILPLMDADLQSPALEQALQDHDIPYRRILFDNAPHGIGTGNGTDAEGWLKTAVQFWEEQTK